MIIDLLNSRTRTSSERMQRMRKSVNQMTSALGRSERTRRIDGS